MQSCIRTRKAFNTTFDRMHAPHQLGCPELRPCELHSQLQRCAEGNAVRYGPHKLKMAVFVGMAPHGTAIMGDFVRSTGYVTNIVA